MVLKTDLSSICVSRGASDDAICFVDAVYWERCPIPYRQPDSLCLSRRSLSTRILLPPFVRPWEPGIYYRLPQVVWEAVGAHEPLSLIPLDIEIEHSPLTGFTVDDEGRGYPTGGKAEERVFTSHLSYGAHTLCGLFPTDTAAKWAALPPKKWWHLHLLGFSRSTRLSIGWLDALRPGAVRLSHCEPLLTRPVEVSRETA
jgi:hypothetical protein